MPTLTTAPPLDPDAILTHAKGRWFYGALIGVWPLAVLASLVAVALGLSVGMALGSGPRGGPGRGLHPGRHHVGRRRR
jgi:hypothetical protein